MEIYKYSLPPLGTNCYLVKTSENSGVIIDPASNGKALIEMAEENGIKIRKILLTHGHFDHMNGAAEIKKSDPDIKLYIHSGDECMLNDGEKALAYFCPELPFFTCTADVVVNDGDIIEQDGVTFTVMHTPGHSAGSVCYICKNDEENIMFAGDTIFRESIGRTDCYSGDYRTQEQTLDMLKNLPDDYILLCGHGPDSTLSHEKKYNPYVADF